MPSDAQIIYTVVLLWLLLWRGGFVVWALVVHMAAYFAALYTMDIGLIGRNDATTWFAVIDAVALVILATRPGLARVMAVLFALRVNSYMANLLFGVSMETTFAVVWAIVVVQVGAVVIGTNSGSGGSGSRSRSRRVRFGFGGHETRQEISGMASGALVGNAGPPARSSDERLASERVAR